MVWPLIPIFISDLGLTPVGTLERGFNLRRSFSRRSSTSSGCLSDKSGGQEHGFESDSPAGGTIKKRPSGAARLPLTSTTWGLVRENEQDTDMEPADNGSMGGGTLRRKAMRNNSKKSIDTIDHKISNDLDVGNPRPCHVAQDPDPLSSAFEQSLSTMMEDEALPLPPPPRVDSVTSLDDIDMLPPPPPDMCISQHYHVSPPVTSDQSALSKLPPPSPAAKPSLTPNNGKHIQNSTLKKSGPSPMQKPSRRISFDDHVQMIEAPRTSQTPSPTPGHQLPPPPPAPMHHMSQVAQMSHTPPVPSVNVSEPVLKYSPQGPIRNNPKKLSANENYNSLPRCFLDNLQKVMSKKWQVAEKCRQNESTSPYEVLGFRDEPINSVGQPNMYSKNSAIGAWVLETQMYAHAQTPASNYYPGMQQQSQQQQQHFHPQQHPCYQVENAHPRGQSVNVPELSDYGHLGQHQHHHEIYGSRQHHQPGMKGFPQQQQQLQQHYHQQQPVVLREPEPSYVDPSRLRANKMKRPPPPPRRSENTQLSNNVI